MDISNIVSQTPQGLGQTTTGRAGKSNLGKDEFLQLLVAQMRNQDPINPMDGTEFASQLAQFNSVEQLINLNDGMSSLAQSQEMMNNGLSNTMAASLAGKTVRAISSQIGLAEGQDADIQFRLGNAAGEVEITVSDASGNVVRTEKLSNLTGGDHSWSWDGKSNAGNEAPEGIYSVSVQAANGEKEVNTLTFIEGEAKKVHYSGNGVELMVNGVYIPLGDVEDIGV